MYTITVKGKTLAELQKNFQNLADGIAIVFEDAKEGSTIKADIKETLERFDAATKNISSKVKESDIITDIKPNTKETKKQKTSLEKDVLPPLYAYAEKYGRAAAQKILKQFGAKTSKELKEKDYPAVIEQLQLQ